MTGNGTRANDAYPEVRPMFMRAYVLEDEQAYQRYALWCAKIGVPAADRETWLRANKSIISA